MTAIIQKALLAAVSLCLAITALARPNIIFILADDLGINGVGSYGGTYPTPNIDALAMNGVRFSHCFSNPVCAPSRAQIMTGQYPFRNGVKGNNSKGELDPHSFIALPKMLRSAGYKTALAGKWQLTAMDTTEDAAAWGFDSFMIWKKGLGGRYWNPGIVRDGEKVQTSQSDYGPDMFQQYVFQFILNCPSDQPFYIHYATPLIHGPIERTPDSSNLPGHDLYADNIAYLDRLVGDLTNFLIATRLINNTMIIFVGDNGPAVDHCTNYKVFGRKVDGHKGQLKEGGSRVPLIAFQGGNTASGIVVDDVLDFSDMYPTLAGLANTKVPTSDGRSFEPQLFGFTGHPREWVFVQLGQGWYVRSDLWKLGKSGKLFDMADAPYKQIKVPKEGQSPEAEAARARLQAILDELNPRQTETTPDESED